MRRRCKIEIERDASGEWRWRVRSPNGRILGPTEGYKRTRGAMRGIFAMREALLNLQADDVVIVQSKPGKAGGPLRPSRRTTKGST